MAFKNFFAGNKTANNCFASSTKAIAKRIKNASLKSSKIDALIIPATLNDVVTTGGTPTPRPGIGAETVIKF